MSDTQDPWRAPLEAGEPPTSLLPAVLVGLVTGLLSTGFSWTATCLGSCLAWPFNIFVSLTLGLLGGMLLARSPGALRGSHVAVVGGLNGLFQALPMVLVAPLLVSTMSSPEMANNPDLGGMHPAALVGVLLVMAAGSAVMYGGSAAAGAGLGFVAARRGNAPQLLAGVGTLAAGGCLAFGALVVVLIAALTLLGQSISSKFTKIAEETQKAEQGQHAPP